MDASFRLSLSIDPPLMNAAGSLGFVPDLRLSLAWEAFGAFVTNPISSRPRKPASGDRWQTYPGGARLHNGYPNPGFRAALREFSLGWTVSQIPVIVHLLGEEPTGLTRQIEELELVENVLAVEVGVREDISAEAAGEMCAAALGEKPVIMRLPLTRALELAEVCLEAGAAAVSLAPSRGALLGDGGLQTGRLYGPGVFPLALEVCRSLAQMDGTIIAAGGVYSRQDVEALLAAGAAAVQVDTALWRGDWFKAADQD